MELQTPIMVSKYPNKKYQLFAQMWFQTTLLGYEYRDEHFGISPSGLVWLGNGICSDGCSPTYQVPVIGLVGPWNGPRSQMHPDLPITARAFFLHDALMERRKLLGIPVEDAHAQFELEIKKSRFFLAALYAWFVNTFGPKT